MKKKLHIIKTAYQNGYAIPQFNINNLEWTKYILEECELCKSPVFLGVSTGAAKYMGGYNVVANLVKSLIKDLNITIPVILHLDHAKTVEDCYKAIDAGFDSIMIDASSYDFDTNIKYTNMVARYGRKCIIEAEIGKIGGTEDNIVSDEYYTSLLEAEQFLKRVKIDMLAPALGSVHGMYKGTPNIKTGIMKQIKESKKTPLVLHGGSGLPDDILIESVKSGVVKINFNTELQVAWHKSVVSFISNNSSVYDPRKIISSGEASLKEVVKHYIKVLGSSNKA